MMMIDSQTEGVLILAKVGGLSGSTVRTIINMRKDLAKIEVADIDAAERTYERLRPSTAQQVLRFHRTQQAAAAGDSEPGPGYPSTVDNPAPTHAGSLHSSDLPWFCRGRRKIPCFCPGVATPDV